MWAPPIVERQIPGNRRLRLGHAVVGAQIDFLVFDRSPKPLDEHIVASGALAVHSDGDLRVHQHAREIDARELTALIRIENVGPSLPGQRFLERLDAEGRFHRDRDAMGQHASAEDIDDRRQIDEAAPHRDVADVRRPDLVRSFDLHPAQQVVIDLVAGAGLLVLGRR